MQRKTEMETRRRRDMVVGVYPTGNPAAARS